jgi:hypothetical protein
MISTFAWCRLLARAVCVADSVCGQGGVAPAELWVVATATDVEQ